MINYTVDFSKQTGENPKMWRAAGLDHLFYLTETPYGKALLDRGSKENTIQYVRNHHTFTTENLLSLPVGGEVYSEDADGNPVYNFKKINAIFKEYVDRGIKPIVEYDYMPAELCRGAHAKKMDEGFASVYAGPSDWDKWEGLLRAFTENLAETFGLDEIRTWYFEVWNEPDGWPADDLDTFYRMYDLFAHVVKSVDPLLRVGGPGTYREFYLKGFLDHVANGKNFVTGEVGAPIDFISHHVYGMSSLWIQSYPLVAPTVQKFLVDLLRADYMIKSYPALKDVPFHLNEWGLCSAYEMTREVCKNLAFRDSEYSALFFVKLVSCLFAVREQFQFFPELMLYWGFAFEAHNGILFNGERSLTTAGNLPKPILSAMEIFSQTCPYTLHTEGPQNANVGIFATGDAENIAVSLYHFNELDPLGGEPKTVSLRVENLPDGVYEFAEYEMNSTENAYRVWEAQGCPKTPGEADMDALWAAATRAPKTFSATVQGGVLALSRTLTPSSFLLLRGAYRK